MGRKLLLYGFGLWAGATLLELSHIVCIFVSIQRIEEAKSYDTGRVRTCASEENRYRIPRFRTDVQDCRKFKSVALTTRPQCPLDWKFELITITI